MNTDSDEAIDIAKFYNVGFHRRDKFFATSKCSNSEFWGHIGLVTLSPIIMFTNCTSPLIKIETYNKILRTFKNNDSKIDSLNTVTDVKEFLYLRNKSINFNPKKAPNSQNLPEVVKLNFAVNIIKKEVMIKKKSVIGNKPKFFKLNEIEGFDIDTELDFEFADYLHKKHF